MSRVMFTASLILVVACMAFVYAYFSPVSSAQNANNQQNRKFQSVERGPGKKMAVDKAGIQRLKDRTGGTVNVATSEATGAARFIKFSNGRGNLASVQGGNARAKSDESEPQTPPLRPCSGRIASALRRLHRLRVAAVASPPPCGGSHHRHVARVSVGGIARPNCTTTARRRGCRARRRRDAPCAWVCPASC